MSVKFKIGDVVTFKSGGPKMTVTDSMNEDVDCVQARWFVDGDLHCDGFYAAELELGDNRSPAEIAAYIEQCIELRHEWASSPDGFARLGPGSPTVPGLEEYGQILAFVKGKEWPDR
jgi:uncharacterized protein YodC (DUF2158 family)